MQSFTATYTMTPQLMRRMFHAVRPWYRVVQWGLPALLLLTGASFSHWSLPVLALLFVVWCEVTLRWSCRPFLQGEHAMTMTFTDSTYSLTTDTMSSSRAWLGYTKAARRGDFWAFRITPLQWVGFPASALTEEQSASLTTLLRGNGLLRNPG